MGHDHDHGDLGRADQRGRLVLVLALSSLVFLAEGVAAWLTGSLALAADAGHVLGDMAGLVLAVAAMAVAGVESRPGSRRSFGWHRIEILAAGANGFLLLALAGWILWSAVGRLREPASIDAPWVLAASALGLVVNLVALLLLRRGSSQSLNVRGAYLEVMGDAFGSLAVIVSAAIVLLTGWSRADTVASLLIAVFIVPRALALIRDVADVLLEAAPRDVDLADLRDHILRTEGVVDVHDLHVWTITSGMPCMSAHVVVDDSVSAMGDSDAVLERLRACLSAHFDVEHSTFQIETSGHVDREPHIHH